MSRGWGRPGAGRSDTEIGSREGWSRPHEDALTVFDRAGFERESASLQSDLGDATAEGVRLDCPELRPAEERDYRAAPEVFGETARSREVQAKLQRL